MTDMDHFRDRLRRLSQWTAPVPEMWTWLKESNLRFGCGPAALEGIENLSKGAPAVVTGQQAGLLTGPLYTIYKAASAVILANRLARDLNSSVVPVFWLASEDHDFQEVRSAWFPAGEEMAQLVFPGEYSLTPAAAIPLRPEDVRDILQQLARLLPQTDFTLDLLNIVAESAGDSFASWCAGILCRLFPGLVILDSCGLPVRRASAPLFAWAVDQGPAIHRALAKKAEEMKAVGIAPGLAVPIQHSHLFFIKGDQRLGLLQMGARFCDRNNTVNFSREQLLAMAEGEPWHLSPNVVLRPLVQERVLPVLAMLGGPGEMAYLEQLKPVFAMLGMEAPPVLPRMGGVLVEPGIMRLLHKYALTPATVQQGLDTWLKEQLVRNDPLGISTAFSSLRRQISEAYAGVTPGLAAIDPQLSQLGNKNMQKVMEQVDWLEKRALASHRQKHAELLQHVNRLRTALAPLGGQQQRMHNCLWYLNKYGSGFIDLLLNQNLDTSFELNLQEMKA